MVVHIVANHIEDISEMLDDLARGSDVPVGVPVKDYDCRRLPDNKYGPQTGPYAGSGGDQRRELTRP